MKTYKKQLFTGERALFHSEDLTIEECTFADGESPLKESKNIALAGTMFEWKYPLWYCKGIQMENCVLKETARAGIWYTHDLIVKNTLIEAPKTFRRASKLTLENVTMPNAEETLWQCSNVRIRNCRVAGDYFAMNCNDMELENFELDGNYGFDGAKNVTIRNARMLTKDAFWNSVNVTVIDSHISGEYFGWNAKNLTLINCTVESLQGMCYIENLVMKNCRIPNTTLAFEYSSVDAELLGKAESILNPTSGRIVADEIGTLTLDEAFIRPSDTKVEIRKNKTGALATPEK